MTIVVVAVAVVVVLAVVFLATTARRDRAAATGLLTRETRKRDRSAAANPVLEDLATEEPTRTGRQVERAAVLERSGKGTAVVVAPKAAPPAPVQPIDEEAYGVTRRQFMNRSIVGMFVLALSCFGAAVLGFLWPALSGGFGSKIKAGSANEILTQTKRNR